ncbi:unnamed protein product [Adineta ricciae]|nr:unnamed protein product [Adineta ricciae]
MTMSSYWEHKKWSMAISAVSCGIGALYSRGTKLSRIGYKVAGPVRAEGGKKVAEMAGAELLKSVGISKVAKETVKRVACKVVEGAAYGFAQGAVDHVSFILFLQLIQFKSFLHLQIVTNYLHGLCNAIQKTSAADVDELFRTHKLNQTILKAFDIMGGEKARLLKDHVTRECFEKTPLYTTILAHCTRLSGSITRGISEGMSKVNIAGGATSTSKMMAFLMNLQSLLKACGVLDEMRKMRDSAAKFLENANQMIDEAIIEHTSSNVSATGSQNMQHLCDTTMQQWKQTIIETSNQVIATHVISPVLSYGVNYLVGYVGDSIKKGYRSYKEEKYRQEFERLKKDFDSKVKDEKLSVEEREREAKAYHKALIELLGKTRNAKLFASILRANIPMDMTCVQACTNVVDQCMRVCPAVDGKEVFTGICIVVQGSDGSSHEYSSSTNPSHRICLTLEDNHFRVTGVENGKAMQNNCFYEALISEVPQLQVIFSDGQVFRDYLSNYIENDESLQYTIAQGWHKFGIEKGSYGGAIDEKKYKPDVLYEKLVVNVKTALTEIYKKNPNLSEKIRSRIQECIREINEIVANDEQGTDKASDIKGKVRELNRWFDDNLTEENQLKSKLKLEISTFGERASQTVRENYQGALDEFKQQATHADEFPTDTRAVHVADRVNFTQDDISLEVVSDESRKLRHDANLIGSIIHAKLNKDVEPKERRYNTVLVGIYKEAVYIAFNQIGKENGQETYAVTEEQCKQICSELRMKHLLGGRYKVIFLEPDPPPTDPKTCRAPHGEMQILHFWKKSGILKEDNSVGKAKPWGIGGSKPACFCCSNAMKACKINHKIYGKANMSPTNWLPPDHMNVKVKMIWNVRTNTFRSKLSRTSQYTNPF